MHVPRRSWFVWTAADGCTCACTLSLTAANAGSRASSTSTTISVVDGTLPIPTGRILRRCGGTCPPKHSSDEPLSLSLQLDAGYEAATITWSGPASAAISGTGRDLTVSSLPQSLGSSLTVNAALSLGSQNGSTSITVPLNFKPACRAMPCLTLVAAKDLAGVNKDIFPTAAFVATAAGIEDVGGGKLT